MAATEVDVSRTVGAGNSTANIAEDIRTLRIYQDRFTGHPIRLQIFEGPLDLLLHLIREHEVDIYDIPVAEITDQYMDYLRLMESLDIELAGDFLVMAATLLVIKSKMLLPADAADEEGEAEEATDPRAELVQRLLEYKRFKEAAETLKSLGELRAMMFDRPLNGHNGNGHNGNGHKPAFLFLNSVSVFDLYAAFRDVLMRIAERPIADIPRQLLTIPIRIKHILHQVRRHPQGITFAQLCEDCDTRHAVIVTFLALLELIRRLRIKVFQERLFGEILVRENGAATIESKSER